MNKNHFLKKAFFQNNRLLFAISILFLSFANAFDVAFAWLMQELFDSAGDQGHFSLSELAVIFIVLFIAVVIAQLIFRVTHSHFVRKAMLQYKKTAIETLLGHTLNDYKVADNSTFLSAMSNDLATIENSYLLGIFTITIRMIQLVVAFGMMLWYHWPLTLISIAASALAFAVSMLFGNRASTAEKLVSEKNDISLSTIKEIIEGFPVIKAFKTEKPITKLYDKSNQDLENAKYSRRMILTLVNIVSQYTGALVHVGIFFLGIYFVHRGYITIGVAVAFVQLMNFVLGPIQTLPELLSAWKAAKQLIYKLENLLSGSASEQGLYALPVSGHEIRLANVSFGYEEGKNVLEDVNLVFEAGKRYAIVGPSGSGKSTLLNLLLHSNDGYQGNIFIGEKELRDISLESLYDNIAVVQQNVFIFDASMKDNITLFRDFPDAEINRAIELSGLKALIAEKGLDYACGEYGSNLSGGEKQRISIARSLLHKSSVLLMDEATAALDAENTWSILSTLLNEDDKTTRIIVTHNLDEALLRKYDQVIVMKNGNVIEQGSFEELLAADGYFRSFYRITV
ncbi:MAG: ABC transporter ATP-binding protein/permease [Lachnospiraceae bacterium]|nr:ABC transporter ATP-binding protein/permease [Lachnospiraceae bacterium]